MDLGIKGRTAIVCAASKGLGKGAALALAQEGVNLFITARTKAEIEAAAEEIARATGVRVTAVAGDITTDEGRSQVLAACPNPDILITNAGGPPAGDFKDFSLDDWRQAVEWSMITPIALIKATVYGMMDRGFGRIVNITSQSVRAPIASLELSNGARTGLTGAIAIIARKSVRRNVTINNILPGPFETDRLRNTSAGMAKVKGVSVDQINEERKQAIPAGRFGNTAEFGAATAFLCSAHAGFITGQNLLMDGGIYPGSM